jgi:hypothetical protein
MTDDRTPPEDPADDADRSATEELGGASTDRTAGAADADRLGTVDLGTGTPAAAPDDAARTAEPAPPVQPAQPARPAQPAQPSRAAQTAQPVPAAPDTSWGGASGWAIAALVVGIGAFLVGLVPVVGLLVALVGVALGVVALVRRRRAQPGLGLGVTGVVLSGVAAVTNVVVVAALVVAVPVGVRLADEAASSWYGWDAGQGLDGDPYGPGQGQDAGGDTDLPDVSTSCWSFSLPDDVWTSGDDGDDDACATSLEVTDDATATATSVDVVTVPAAVASGLVPTTSTDRVADAVAALRTSWLPGVGTVVGEPEPTTLDGEPATLVRLAAGTDLGTAAAVVVAWSPADATGASSLTLVTVGADVDEDLGDDSSDGATAGARAAATERTLTSVTSTWDWAVA